MEAPSEKMKIVIFAGGTGTRLWPLSRSKTPKQFEQMFDGKSTIQLAFERVAPVYGAENIYISTNERYAEVLKNQLPEIPEKNFLLEPAKRDLAPAVGLSFMRLQQEGYKGPVAIIWADHLMDRVEEFRKALKAGQELLAENPNRFVYVGEKPRFANHNLGWITVGDKIQETNGLDTHEFESWYYRPPLDVCEAMFASGNSVWNPGYFVTTVDFVVNLYKDFMPEMHTSLSEAVHNPDKLSEIYPNLESISFDDAIVSKTEPHQAVVVLTDMHWSDPGTLYALKEALADSEEENVIHGKAVAFDTSDTLIYNKSKDQLIAAIGLEGFVIVNTGDAIVVVHKDRVPDVKKMLKTFEGTDLEQYT